MTGELLAKVRRKRVLTAGECAKLCHVAPRTLGKWVDEGRLKGFRLPGSQDRRIPRENLLAFMRANGIPTHELEGALVRRVLFVGAEHAGAVSAHLPSGAFDHDTAASLFEAGLLFGTWRPDAAVVDLALGREQCAAAVRDVRATAHGRGAYLVALAFEDEVGGGELLAAGFDLVVRRPLDPARVAERVREVTGATR